MTDMKIQVIDDDPAMTDLLQLLLVESGANIQVANSGQKGLEMVQANIPDVIILDLMMAGMDGWAVCREVRKFSKVPILILSALNSSNIIASSLDAGADDYLVKPVPTTVLLAHIKNLIKRTAPLYTPLQNGTKLSKGL